MLTTCEREYSSRMPYMSLLAIRRRGGREIKPALRQGYTLRCHERCYDCFGVPVLQFCCSVIVVVGFVGS